jgi:hypothetical protein
MPRKNPAAYRRLNAKPKSQKATTKTICVTYVIPALDGTEENSIASDPGDPDEAAMEALIEKLYVDKSYILAVVGNADNSRTVITTKRGVPVESDTDEAEQPAEPEAEEPAV